MEEEGLGHVDAQVQVPEARCAVEGIQVAARAHGALGEGSQQAQREVPLLGFIHLSLWGGG